MTSMSPVSYLTPQVQFSSTSEELSPMEMKLGKRLARKAFNTGKKAGKTLFWSENRRLGIKRFPERAREIIRNGMIKAGGFGIGGYALTNFLLEFPMAGLMPNAVSQGVATLVAGTGVGATLLKTGFKAGEEQSAIELQQETTILDSDY